MTISDRVITMCREHVGDTETSSNKAPWLTNIMKAGNNPTHWLPGEPYCIAALLALFNLACEVDKKDFPIAFSKSTQQFFENARQAKYITASPAVGDIVIFQMGSTWQGHAGIITDILKTDKGIPYGIVTIEFNTSGKVNGDQRNGEGCYSKVRLFKQFEPTKEHRLWIKGFIRTSSL